MDIKLEDIDAVKKRTGVSYKEAKEALEKANGSVIDAIIYLEQNESKWTETMSVKGSELIDKIKEIVKKGNVTKIRVKKDDKVVVDIPVTASVISTVIFPYFTLLAAIVALAAEYTLEIKRPDDTDKSELTKTE